MRALTVTVDGVEYGVHYYPPSGAVVQTINGRFPPWDWELENGLEDKLLQACEKKVSEEDNLTA